MAHFEVYDGTREAKYGKTLLQGFGEIAKYQRITLNAEPGTEDLVRYRIVKDAERVAYNPRREQVHLLKLMAEVCNNPLTRITGRTSLILTEKDIYADGLNYCYGSTQSDGKGGYHIIMSTARVRNMNQLLFTTVHEIGHLLGAAKRSTNTVENLGSHCTNSCVMEQRLGLEESIQHMNRITRRENMFCDQCIQDLRSEFHN